MSATPSRNAPLLKEVPEGNSDIQSGEKEGNIGVAEVYLGFSVRCYGKTQKNFLANAILMSYSA